MDENGRSIISIRSPFDDSTIRTEQSLDLNYVLTQNPPLSGERPQTTTTPASEPFDLQIDPEILTMIGILAFVVLCVIIWVLKGKDE